MGFGSLFVGYFLLLNVTPYRGFSDIIAAVVMLLGLYKLAEVNRSFKISAIICAVFAVISAGELVISVLDLFSIFESALIFSILTMLRHAVVGTLCVTAMMGIRDVSGEVDIPKIHSRARYLIPATFTVYVLLILLEGAGGFMPFIPPVVLAWISLITIIANITIIAFGVFTIYCCYMQICMPEDDVPLTPEPEKPSRFAFINEHRKRKREREIAYMEEKLAKREARLKKKSKGEDNEQEE